MTIGILYKHNIQQVPRERPTAGLNAAFLIQPFLRQHTKLKETTTKIKNCDNVTVLEV